MPTLRMISSIVALVSLCACAQPTAAVKPTAGPTLAGQRNSACLSETGSRIPSSGASCSAFGHSYSSEDINSTGSTTAAGSLRLLDPSITVH